MRLRSGGRGRFYTPARGLIESALRVAYRGDWPARAWARVPGACDVERTDIDAPLLGGNAPALRVGFVSDLHLGPTTPARLLERAFDELADARLDVLLLGGDYVFLDADDRRADLLAGLVRKVPAARKLAVLGNHDLWTEHALLEDALRSAGVDIVTNTATPIDARGVFVVGLDDPWTGTPDASSAFASAADARAMIVLCHSPAGLPLVPRAGVPKLFLCGHTHGGHIATPWGPIVTAAGRYGRAYSRGRHAFGDVDVYVSRGVGGIELPMRAYARPEVVVVRVT